MDTTKIAGYENMTDAEKIAALEKYEFDTSGFVSKSVLDKATADAAEWKRKYNDKLSEDERKAQADEEARKATETRLAELERKDKITNAKDKYIASGFTVELAQSTAEAFVDGKMDVVLENLTKHATHIAEIEKDKALKGTPTPPASGNPNPGNIDYKAKADEAMAQGKAGEAAYYMRLYHEQK